MINIIIFFIDNFLSLLIECDFFNVFLCLKFYTIFVLKIDFIFLIQQNFLKLMKKSLIVMYVFDKDLLHDYNSINLHFVFDCFSVSNSFVK